MTGICLASAQSDCYFHDGFIALPFVSLNVRADSPFISSPNDPSLSCMSAGKETTGSDFDSVDIWRVRSKLDTVSSSCLFCLACAKTLFLSLVLTSQALFIQLFLDLSALPSTRPGMSTVTAFYTKYFLDSNTSLIFSPFPFFFFFFFSSSLPISWCCCCCCLSLPRRAGMRMGAQCSGTLLCVPDSFVDSLYFHFLYIYIRQQGNTPLDFFIPVFLISFFLFFDLGFFFFRFLFS
jgi:hypothetical protein